jgi:hypothetical protein
MRGIGEGWDDAAGLGQRGGEPDACFVRFGIHPKEDAAASAKEGRPIYKETEYVEIMVAGDKQNVVHRPVTEKDKKRFRRQYEDWKRNAAQAAEGTPLEQWPSISRSQVEELRYFNIRTVEQLAALSDGNAAIVGPVLSLKQKAVDFLAAAKGTGHLTSLRAELSAKDNQIATMAAQIAALQETVDSIRSERGDDKPRRGRPPKSDLES